MSEAPKEPTPLQRLVAAHRGIWSADAPAMSFLPAGWYAIVHKLLTDIESYLGGDIQHFRIEQVKEKYASLRLYYSWSGRTRPTIDAVSPDALERFTASAPDAQTQRVDELIAGAEAECSSACQQCSAPARRRDTGGWLATLCDTHAAEKEAEDADDEDE